MRGGLALSERRLAYAVGHAVAVAVRESGEDRPATGSSPERQAGRAAGCSVADAPQRVHLPAEDGSADGPERLRLTEVPTTAGRSTDLRQR